MSTQRHCDFYPTAKGWFMNLAPNEYGRHADSDTYGPTDNIRELEIVLNGFSNPGGCQVSFVLRHVPKKAPNGTKINAVPYKPISGVNVGLSRVPARFLIDGDYDEVYLYDTATDLQFTLVEKQITMISTRDLWTAIAPTHVEIEPPTTEKGWLKLVAESVRSFRAAGEKYHCVIIEGLERQPMTVEEIWTL